MSKEVKNEVSSSEVDTGIFEDAHPSLWQRVNGRASLQLNESRMATGTKWSNKG
jgi:hypothetical protein